MKPKTHSELLITLEKATPSNHLPSSCLRCMQDTNPGQSYGKLRAIQKLYGVLFPFPNEKVPGNKILGIPSALGTRRPQKPCYLALSPLLEAGVPLDHFLPAVTLGKEVL